MTEQQPYAVVRRSGGFELRRYPAHVVAEVGVLAPFDRAGNAAFRRLFRYISGANTARRSVPMTAPVVQGSDGPRRARSETLPMTAPVVQRGPVGTDAAEEQRYLVAFVLPADMTEDTAPVPTDPGIMIRTVPASLAAALRFSGSGSGAAFAKRSRELLDAVHAAGLTPVGTPRFARFDPPYMPWILRRNEVVQDIAEDSTGPRPARR